MVLWADTEQIMNHSTGRVPDPIIWPLCPLRSPPPPSSSLMIYRSSEQSPSDSLWRQTLWSRFWFHRENMMIYIHVIGQLSKPQTNHSAIMLFYAGAFTQQPLALTLTIPIPKANETHFHSGGLQMLKLLLLLLFVAVIMFLIQHGSLVHIYRSTHTHVWVSIFSSV